MCLPDEGWDDITEVNSHPVALMQCRDFLKKHPEMKIVETDDTAGSAKNIKEVNIVFAPGADFENLINRAKFNPVASRVVQNAALKAEKNGEANVDIEGIKKK